MAAPHSTATSETRVSPAWALVIATLSLAAALIHAAAVGEHAGAEPLAQLFAVSAVIQGGWALLVIARPTRDTLAVGFAANLVFVAVYCLSRVIAIPVIGIDAAESVGFQDLTCALLEGALVAATGFLLLAPRTLLPSFRRLGFVPAAALLFVVMLMAVPALASGHSHGETAHAHGDVETASDTQAHDHDTTTGEHDATAEPVSTASQQRADEVVAETEEYLPEWSDHRTAEADGFVSIGDGMSGFEHYVHAEWSATQETLDAKHPESLVYAVNADGTKTLVSAMYITAPGTSMDDVPDVGGAPWHIHDNLCWDESGQRLAGIAVNGRCFPGGTLRETAPMLHVWIVPNVCGQFADLENSSAIRGDSATRGGGLAARIAGAFGGDAAAANADGSPNCSATHSHG